MTITLFPPTMITTPLPAEFNQDTTNQLIVAIGTQAASAANLAAAIAAPFAELAAVNAGTSAGSAGDAAKCAAQKAIAVVIDGVTYYLAAFTQNT